MSTKTKIAAVALAALTLAGSLAVTSNEAQAKGGKKAFAIGLGAAALFGAAAASSYGYDHGYYGHRRCFWDAHYNEYGELVRVRVCDRY
jgi:hypothetical protein